MSDIAIRVQNLSKRYRLGTVRRQHDTLRDHMADMLQRFVQRRGTSSASSQMIWALNDASFDIHWGEVVGVIGHNGAGKSTLLKLLSRIMEPTRGRAEIYGRVGSLLEVGTGFHPELTGRENVYLSGAILGMKRTDIRRKFDDIISFAQVERFVDTPVKRYSSGMYVRLGFAVAAHLEPDILIVDEVLAVGDAAFQKKCINKMDEVAQHGRAVLFTSHNMPALANMCDRAFRLDQGIIVDQGNPVDVIQRYLFDDQPQPQQDLTNHPGRPRGKSALLRSVRLSQHGEATATFTTGRAFDLEVTCLADQEMSRALNLAFQIRDSNGTWILGSHTDEYGSACANHGGEITFRAHINHLILNPGTYSLTLFLDASDGVHTLDSVENAISFDVVWLPISDFVPRKDRPLVHALVQWDSTEVGLVRVDT